jgi:uncharacterized membrane protein
VTARLRKFLNDLGDSFWLVPGVMVLAGVVAAVGLVQLDRMRAVPEWLVDGRWLYNGGATGARTLLGAVASSTIGVAGTVFTITIAALSLAAGQMGPRLLHNFTRDRGVQFTLGAFLGTFAYSLMVLRNVRTLSEGEFIPHLALTMGIVFAFVCVATLVYFVGHMAGRINVDTVVDLVSQDVRRAIHQLAADEVEPAAPPDNAWRDSVPIADARCGYLQQLDGDGLADWAAEQATTIRLLVRPGDYVFPGASIALATARADGMGGAIRNATALGAQRVSSADLEFAVRQLVEVAVRALSPGVNDPHTAMSVLDRLGTARCDVVTLNFPSGVFVRDDRIVLVVPSVDYNGLTDAMFHMIRQNAANCPAVLIRMLEILTAVVSYESNPSRLATLQRHADLILGQAELGILAPADLADVRARHADFAIMKREGPAGLLGSSFCGASKG